MNNNSNNCGDCGTTCSECGRPWAICKQDGGCGCNKCKDIKFCEYGRMANGCIREKQPGCPMQAVIPSVTIESIDGIKNLADCLVHVSDINTTFYIDDKHRPIITWAGPIDIPGYDMEGNPNNYRDQIVTDVANQIAVIYDKSGKGYMFGLVENIDLQDEINNKLDEMAEDGTLQEIIGDYLNATAVWGFDTVADMQSSTNLIDGSYARCLGHTNIKDGGGGLYKIRTVTTADVIDGIHIIALTDTLVAELIDSQISIKNQVDNDVKLISDKYSFSVEYINNTFIYKTVIPKANINKFALLATNGDTSDPHGAGRKSVSNLANSVDYDILINAGLHGIMIFDGNSYEEANDSPYYIGFTEDLEMHFYDAVNNTITLATLEADNIVNACCGYSPLIVNGEAYDYTEITSAGTSISNYFRDYIVPIRHTRQIIAEDADNIILYSVIGRKNRSFGMTYDELITWLGTENVTNAFNLDGGGSTQEVIAKTMTYPSQDYDNGRGRVVPTAFGFKF